MTRPSFQKDKVWLILRMAIFQMFCMYHLWHQISLVSIRWHILECLREFLSAQMMLRWQKLHPRNSLLKGLANHHAKAYDFSHFFVDANPTTLLTHGNEVIRLWHERFGHLNFKYLLQLQKKSMVEGLPVINATIGICKGVIHLNGTSMSECRHPSYWHTKGHLWI